MSGMSDQPTRVVPLLLVAGFSTLAVTVVRTIGEIQQWDPFWFNPEAGSPLNPFGIVWLVPVFGFLFGRNLSRSGAAPRFVTGFFVPMFGFLATMAGGAVIGAQFEGQEMRDALTWFFYVAPAFALLALFAWPRAFVVLLGYALFARVPVMLVQYLDVANDWQTHYGRLHPKLGLMSADDRIWMLTLAQAGLWIPFTVTLGSAFAAIGAATTRSK